MKRFILMVVILVVCGSFVQAGMLGPYFAKKLQSMSDADITRAIIEMADRSEIQAEIVSLERDLDRRNAGMEERHYVIVSTLMRRGKESQANLLRYLESEKAKGNVVEYKSFWLDNSAYVKAKKSVILEIVRRGDVGKVYEDAPIKLIEPVGKVIETPRIASIEIGIRNARADSLWRKGIDGLGRLAFILDTGVQGDDPGGHAALYWKWRGWRRNGASLSEAWKDALGGQQRPIDTHGHGTHVCGTVLGSSRVTPDTVGMAPGGQWMADNAINQGTGSGFDADVREAYQWAADPDANPATNYDVPDGCCNSWGIDSRFSGYKDCDDRWQTVIDNLERAGCVVEYSAGNEGPTSQTLRSPANICSTETRNYAVAAVDGNQPWPHPIASFSSRGPSDCNTSVIKPEVAAPGVSVRSSLRSGGYGTMSGTSMAGPHVTGAFLLLRQYNTNATPDQVKMALINSARDEGPTGNDNTYGWGFIDVNAAVNALVRGPSLAHRGYGIADSTGNGNRNGLPDPGERCQLVDTIWSAGGRRATGITGILRKKNPAYTFLTIEDSVTTFPDLDSVGGANRIGWSLTDRYVISVSRSIPPADSLIPLTQTLRSNGGSYTVTNLFVIRIGNSPVAVEEQKTEILGPKPTEFALSLPLPSILVNEARIRYELPFASDVSIKVYNVSGQLVKTLVSEREEAGYKSVRWNGRDDAGRKVGSGVYFIRMRAGGFSDSKKIMVMR